MCTGGSIRIEFDQNGLKAQIIGNRVSDSSWQQVKLLLTGVDSEEIEIGEGQNVEIPWSDFRRILLSFAKLARREDINVVFDERTNQLLEAHVRDLQSANSGVSETDPSSGIERTLNELGFRRRLKAEQLRDVNRLVQMRHGANFSVPGSGKTTALLAVHSILKSRGLVSKLLVVSPRNAFISWESEIGACLDTSRLTMCRLTGGRDRIRILLSTNPDIALVSYQQLPIVLDEVMAYALGNSLHLVLDESHRIKKGYPGVFFSSAATIADFVVRRDIMSGTPMPQSLADLVPQFDYLWPGVDILSELNGVQDTQERVRRANRRLRSHYVRTTKGELNLPPPTTTVVDIPLGPIQREIYQLLRSEAARVAAGMDRDNITRFRVLGKQVMRLLQAASNPALITSNDEYPEELSPIPAGSRGWELLSDFSKYERPAKVEYAIKRVRELANEEKKTVVWSAFVRNVQLLESKLADLGAVTIYGAIETGDEDDAETREWRLRKFHQSNECMVLIANPAAGGEGISLHRVCHNAIYLDRTFNAAHYLQSVDRIHRLGLDPRATTSIEILEANDTIDHVLDGRIKSKIKTMAAVFEDKDLQAIAYDPFDVVEENPAGIDAEDEVPIIDHLREP